MYTRMYTCVAHSYMLFRIFVRIGQTKSDSAHAVVAYRPLMTTVQTSPIQQKGKKKRHEKLKKTVDALTWY